MRGSEVCPTNLLNLSQNYVICIEKGSPNNFAQVTQILDNLYWKHLLIKNVNEIPVIEVFLGSKLNVTIKVLTWGLANDYYYTKNIQYNLKIVIMKYQNCEGSQTKVYYN